jgi:hypothetical protein
VARGVTFQDWSVDVDQVCDDELAGQVNTQAVIVPTRRHLELYRLLRSNSHRDRAGRLVSWWPQAKLAGRLGVSVRTVQRLLADLREPGPDPRHPKRAPGLRLGLVKVEATTYRDQASRRHRLGGNLYVLAPGQHATLAEPVSPAHVNTIEQTVSCLNKSPTPSLEEKGEYLGVTGVGQQRPLELLDYDPSEAQVLATLRAGLGEVEVVWPATPRWANRHPRYRPAGKGARPLPLAGDLEDFHAAIDALDADTVPESYAAKVNGRRRGNRARG